jgi:DNA-binding response OmpR family regulator
MKILIADDDPVYVRLVSSRLTAKGIEVVTAYDAMQAWMTTMRSQPDAIILDINMPAGTGHEFLKRLRMMPKTAHIPVVVVSGSIRPEERSKVISIGADEYLPKPVDFDQLYRALWRLLGMPPPESRSETERPTASG